MKQFLRSVADAYTERHKDMSRFIFVFPGKRAATFFRSYISASVPDDSFILEPELITISDLAERLSGLVPDNHTDLLLRLFSIYRKISPEAGKDFSRFRRWGETALSDISDVMMYQPDTSLLFQNLIDYNSIATDYLTEEQKSVVMEYFPNVSFDGSVRSFWKHFNQGTDTRKSSFLALWEVMEELLEKFNDSLIKDGLSYSGLALSRALKNLREQGRTLLPDCDRIIFVGFNALSTVERGIFTEFSKLRNDDDELFADFYWDIPGDVVANASAGRFVRPNARRFKSQYDISSSSAPGMPEKISIIAAPSNTAQTQVISSVISKWLQNSTVTPEMLKRAKVAVVLPDEGLLMPLIYSIPQGLDSINLTMGYPLKQSLAGTLVQLVVNAYRASRIKPDGDTEYFYKHVLDILSHPYLRLIFPDRNIRLLHDAISSSHRMMVSLRFIARHLPGAEKYFINEPKDDAAAALTSLVRILELTQRQVGARGEDNDSLSGAMVHVRNELNILGACIDAVRITAEGLEKYDIEPKSSDALALLNSLLSSGTVRFEGEPLSGLQIIGALETRMLDFDYVIIPSLNEGKYPVTIRKNSLIPEKLRRGFGMSTSRFRESMYAYNFYRLIARAKEVVLIYDSRIDELTAGAPSRYLAQLRELYARNIVKEYSAVLSGKMEKSDVAGSSGDHSLLAAPFFTPGSERCLSASAINKYISCPLSFFSESLCGIYELEEPDEYLSPSNFGTVLHETLRELYPVASPAKGVKITEQYLDRCISQTDRIRHILIKNIHRFHIKDIPKEAGEKEIAEAIARPLTSDLRLLLRQMLDTVIATLRYDRSKTPFNYFGSEVKVEGTFSLPGCGEVNLKAKIDRIDDIGGSVRVVDYKSGSASIETFNKENFFKDAKYHQELQLGLYSWMLRKSGLMPALTYFPVATIYPIVKMGADELKEDEVFKKAVPAFAKGNDAAREEYFQYFEEGLGELLLDIKTGKASYNPPDEAGSICEYCMLADSLCPTAATRRPTTT